MPIEVVSVWLLFSSDRPYENYSLTLRSPDESKPPRMVETRYTIDHPYGSLIGWSLVKPRSWRYLRMPMDGAKVTERLLCLNVHQL